MEPGTRIARQVGMSRRVLWHRLPVLVLLAVCTSACGADEPSSGSSGRGSTDPSSPGGGAAEAPEECVGRSEATRDDLEGDAVWARFCPGPDGLTAPAEIPSEALVSHLDRLGELTAYRGTADEDDRCRPAFTTTYRLQVGFADGQVAQVSGVTDPTCPGTVHGPNVLKIRGPADRGVYGVVMSAFGQQYADQLGDAPADEPLACPDDPRNPDSVSLDGASTALDTGIRYGRPEPMVMPVTAVRGVLCTWEHRADAPTVRELSADEAERVRIGMHALNGAMVDCGGSPDPTYTVVVEDKTGTRRAVTIIESECSTVIASGGRFGLGFAWLDRD